MICLTISRYDASCSVDDDLGNPLGAEPGVAAAADACGSAPFSGESAEHDVATTAAVANSIPSVLMRPWTSAKQRRVPHNPYPKVSRSRDFVRPAKSGASPGGTRRLPNFPGAGLTSLADAASRVLDGAARHVTPAAQFGSGAQRLAVHSGAFEASEVALGRLRFHRAGDRSRF